MTQPSSLLERYTDLQLSLTDRRGGASVSTGDPFVVQLIQLLFTYGLQIQASDIHIEPISTGARIRYRIDGVLHEMLQISDQVRDPLIRAIKTKAGLLSDPVGRSKPQDGHMDFQIDGKILDLRLSSFPTLFGDVLALRIFDHDTPRLKLEQLGISPGLWKPLDQAIHHRNGLLLVTGPTNSGKTTTLYAILEQLRSPHVKMVTLEDPVEYQMEGVNQGQINPQVGLTFASGLRAILRQDANIILVGEIRDKETTEIAIRAALTGHLVLSSLHTNHACGTISRLLDMEVEPPLIISAVIGILAMRLVRLVCRECAIPDSVGSEIAVRLMAQAVAHPASASVRASSGGTYQRGKGCHACGGTGYRGRTAVFEFLRLSDELKQIILERSSGRLYQTAVSSGMTTMLLDGLEKCSQGLTTVEEVLRVVGDTSES